MDTAPFYTIFDNFQPDRAMKIIAIDAPETALSAWFKVATDAGARGRAAGAATVARLGAMG